MTTQRSFPRPGPKLTFVKSAARSAVTKAILENILRTCISKECLIVYNNITCGRQTIVDLAPNRTYFDAQCNHSII